MRAQHHGFRLSTVITTAAILLGSTAMTVPTWAQQPTQPYQMPAPDAAPADQNAADPPARVGRLVATSGAVSYHAAGDTEWTAASTNFPVATGGSFWTQPNAQAEMELSASRIGLSGGTEVDIGTLDANGLRATLTQGETFLRPRDLAPNETWTLVTPRGTVTTSQAGQISVVAGDTASPTVVTVLAGSATITAPGVSQTLSAGQAVSISGTDTFVATVGQAEPDAFVQAELAQARPPLPPPASAQSVPPPPAIVGLPGGDELAGYGSWNNDAEYGQVWYPAVDATWVPYRDGHWAFVAPWGWTWIDAAPWGFAPFHYGRWVELHGRWGWTPQFDRDRHDRYPVYAPALVTFLGIGAGMAIGSRPVGWVPLGPREPYRPWFHASARFVTDVNGPRAITVAGPGAFRNRGAATMVPEGAFVGSRPIRGVAQPITAQILAGAHPLTGPHPIMPSATTAGVTPFVAQQFHVAAPASGFVHAPGPAVVPHANGAAFPVLRGPEPGRPAGPTFIPRVNTPSGPEPHGSGVGPNPSGPGEHAPVVVPHIPGAVEHGPVVGPNPTGPGEHAPGVVPHVPGQVEHGPVVGPHPAPPVEPPHPPPPPHVEAPHPAPPPPPHMEAPHPAPPPPLPHVETPHPAPPPPPPHVETPHPAPPPPPPHVEPPHPTPPPPPPHVEPPHPAPPPPPPHVEPPHPAPPPPPPHDPGERKPGEH